MENTNENSAHSFTEGADENVQLNSFGFGPFVYGLRINKNIPLREFCRMCELDPSNWSKVERLIASPPNKKNTLKKISSVLSLSSHEEEQLVDLALIGSMHPDLKPDEEILSKLPILIQTLRGDKPNKSELLNLIERIKSGLGYKDATIPDGWVKSSDRLPEENVSVLVFIPEEDNHITTGIWDVSKKWVLLDDYRVPFSQVTYWHPMIEAPKDKEYIPHKYYHDADELESMSDTINRLQKENFELETRLTSYKNNLKEYIEIMLAVDTMPEGDYDWNLGFRTACNKILNSLTK